MGAGAEAVRVIARLSGPRPLLDARTAVARADLVDVALAGQVAAARYVAPVRMRCVAARTAVRKAGDVGAVAVSELLYGEAFDLFETVGAWVFGRCAADCYVGWVLAEALEVGDKGEIRVNSRVAPVFSHADIKAAVGMELPFGALVSGETGARFVAISAGFVHGRHVAEAAWTVEAAARVFMGAPYLWGGRTPAGVDCSGLVQAALAACGTACPRDSDQQLAGLGVTVAYEARAAGDFVFFPGHVGLLVAGDRLLHANAHWMAVVEEPLADVIGRLVEAGVAEPVSGVRRVSGCVPPES